MKTLLLVASFIVAVAAFAADADSIPAFPSELKLSSGAVLRKCEVVRWTADAVVVRHAGGIDPVRFANLAPDSRARIDEILTAFKQPRTIRGTVFVTTRGAGAYKFANTLVVAYPAAAFPSGAKVPSDSATPLAITHTDADGRYTLKLKDSSPAVVYCFAKRVAAGDLEITRWVVPINRAEIDLSELNSLD
jgi:hypothetical protein